MSFMNRILYLFATILMLWMPQSCLLENDISYPYIKGEITVFEVEGQVSSSINTSERKIHVVLEETADIERVRVKDVGLNPEAHFSEELPEYLDLSSPVTVVVQTYQNYIWTISATRPIARYVKCENEAMPAQINERDKAVTVFVNESQPLESIVINDMKLEPTGAEIMYTYKLKDNEEVDKHDVSFPADPLTVNCVSRRYFLVRYKGEDITWTLDAVQVRIEMKINSVVPWCYSADVSAEYSGTGDPYVQYRRASDEEWTDVRDVTLTGSTISCNIGGLAEGTGYEVRLANGEDRGESLAFTTGTPDQLVNMGFDDWYQNDKGTWFPNVDATVKVWDTANGGAALLKKNPTAPEYEFLAVDRPGNKAAARLESMVVGMFAAGNIYSGLFKKASLTGGVGAVLDWGSPFSGRPCSLKGYYSYSPKTIDRVKAPYEDLKGTMDKCQLLVLLTDWDKPFEVNTAANIFVDQENDPHIIAYARYESDEDTGGKYREFELPLEYRRPDGIPKYAVVIACASYKGDFFTGGVGSVMYVDEFQFVYR